MDPFERERPRLLSLAYRMLGSSAEAEDVVQEAWLRWQQSTPGTKVQSLSGYLGTVVTRLCLDQLKSARVRRESYVGPWLPEPMLTGGQETDRESISMAFLVLLERLSPVERAVYLLHQVFDYSHAEVAAMVDKDEAACRQLYHRAKQHLLDGRPRFARSREEHQKLLGAFLGAVARGDLDGLRALLTEGATLWSDGGGKAQAALKPVEGAERIARFFVGVMRFATPDMTVELAEVNGWPAAILRTGGVAEGVYTIETDGERIHALHVVRNPDKLTRV